MDLKQIRRYGFEQGLGLNYISKEEKITKILNQLFILFEEKVVLKGGTALNRVYLKDNARFSEDIDLDYFNENKNNAIKEIEKKMKEFSDFEVAKSRLMNDTLRYDTYYINELNHKDKVQIEFYLNHEKIIGQTKKRIINSQLIESNSAIFNVYSMESLISRKIVAAFNREEGKDMYDLFYSLNLKFSKKETIKIIKELCDFNKIKFNELKVKLPVKIENMMKNYKMYQNTTNHYLSKKNNISWEFLLGSLKANILLFFEN
jgi:uncharacterized protein